MTVCPKMNQIMPFFKPSQNYRSVVRQAQYIPEWPVGTEPHWGPANTLQNQRYESLYRNINSIRIKFRYSRNNRFKRYNRYYRYSTGTTGTCKEVLDLDESSAQDGLLGAARPIRQLRSPSLEGCSTLALNNAIYPTTIAAFHYILIIRLEIELRTIVFFKHQFALIYDKLFIKRNINNSFITKSFFFFIKNAFIIFNLILKFTN